MFSKIEIPSAAIRLITLACYFLPFVFFFTTCVDGVPKNAYNKEDAIANEKEKVAFEKKDIFEAATNAFIDNIRVNDSSAALTSETINILQSLGDNWYFYPTPTSVSAIGAVVFLENIVGRVALAISILLSALTFLIWRFINRKRISIYFISTNLLVTLIFIAACLISNITIMYGAYILVFLLLVQLSSEFQNKKKTAPSVDAINPS